MRIFGSLTNLLVTPGQQQGAGIADLGLDQAEIAGCIEQAGIPAFPVRQQFFDLIPKAHGPTVAEPAPRDNDVDPNLRATVRSGFFQDLEQRYARRKCHPPQNNELHLRQELQWRVRYFGGHDIQQRQQCIHNLQCRLQRKN